MSAARFLITNDRYGGQVETTFESLVADCAALGWLVGLRIVQTPDGDVIMDNLGEIVAEEILPAWLAPLTTTEAARVAEDWQDEDLAA